MKRIIIIMTLVLGFLTPHFVTAQSKASLPVPEELMQRIANSDLLQAKVDKSFIPDDKLYYEATQTEDRKAIEETLLNYIEGTANGEPDRIRQAFHKDLNLYSVKNGMLNITNGQQYIGYFKQGQKNDRKGTIVSIDVVNDAAIAKVEITSDSRKRRYTDYMMLLKIEGAWKIIHKSYTSEGY